MLGKEWLGGTLLAALSAAAMAAGGVSGDIHFRGTVVDHAPRWSWYLVTPEQHWDVNVEEGVIDPRGHQVFNLAHLGPLPFLEGHLNEVAPQGGSGMIPVITLTSGNQPLPRLSGGSTAGQRYQTAVPVLNAESGEAVGQLRFVVEQGLVVARGRTAARPEFGPLDHQMALVAGDTVPDPRPGALSPALSARLSELLASNGGRSVTGPAVLAPRVVKQSVLSNPQVRDIAAAYASQLSEFTLLWPQHNVPARWKATLSVTVMMQ